MVKPRGKSPAWSFLIGAAIALPAGIMIGRSGTNEPLGEIEVQRQGEVSGSGGRNVYSPNVLSDPYVIEEHKRIAEALENSCRQSNLHCDEARQARQRIREATAGQ